jgi:hypothetical protein
LAWAFPDTGILGMSDFLQLRDSSGVLFQGVEFQQNRLVLPDELEPDKLRDLIRVLLTVDSCSAWWLGDLLAFVKRTRRFEFAEEIASQSENKERLLDAQVVAENFRVRANLSYYHHVECLRECGSNPDLALEWLKKAEINGWSVPTLRREIRIANSLDRSSIAAKSSKHKGGLTLTAVAGMFRQRLNAITSEHPIEKWSTDELEALRFDLQPIARLLTELDRRLEFCR